jgi:hypothetical protein
VALVTAAVISVLVFPTIAIALRKAGGSPARGDPAQAEAGLAPEAESPTDAGLAPGQGGSAPTDPGLAPA